ncbi:MAG: lipopolysaccharide biosynthesis protein [bacterium]
MYLLLVNLLTKAKKSKIFKDSVSYTFLNTIEKAIPFLILPILTRLLTKEEVGYYILYQAIIEVVFPIMTLQIDSAILLNYYKLDKRNFKEYFSNAIILFFAYYLILFFLLYAFSNTLSTLLSFPTVWLNIVFAIVFFRFLTNVRQHLWQIKYKIKNYGLFTIGISIVKNVLGLILVIYTTMAWEGIIAGHLIGYALFGLIALISFYKEKLIFFKRKLIYYRDIFKIGAPLTIHRLGLWFGKAANRVIITSLLGAAATGSYGVGATFAAIVTVLEQSFAKAFKPHLFENLRTNSRDSRKKIIISTYFIYAFIFFISVSLYFIGFYSVGFLFGEEYTETRKFMFPLIVAAMFKGFFELHVNYILFTKRTMQITKITLASGLINVVLAYFCTKYFGLIGTAYSLAIINFIQYTVTFYVSNKLFPMSWLFFLNKAKLRVKFLINSMR